MTVTHLNKVRRTALAPSRPLSCGVYGGARPTACASRQHDRRPLRRTHGVVRHPLFTRHRHAEQVLRIFRLFKVTSRLKQSKAVAIAAKK